jgi:hypothetical protein
VAWKLTVRVGPKVERSRYDQLADALDALEARARELSQDASGRTVDVKFRRFEPVEQVVARIELAGPQRVMPRVRAGVDVRGDGSTEAYLGHLTRDVITERGRESAYAALRRELASAVGDG